MQNPAKNSQIYGSFLLLLRVYLTSFTWNYGDKYKMGTIWVFYVPVPLQHIQICWHCWTVNWSPFNSSPKSNLWWNPGWPWNENDMNQWWFNNSCSYLIGRRFSCWDLLFKCVLGSDKTYCWDIIISQSALVVWMCVICLFQWLLTLYNLELWNYPICVLEFWYYPNAFWNCDIIPMRLEL